MFGAIDISTSGLMAERARFTVIANNIANMETTRQPDGTREPYRRRVAVFVPGGIGRGRDVGVHVDRIHEDESDFKVVYRPGHPDADAEGNVRMPNVNLTTEMIDHVAALRAYQANVTAMNAAKTMLVNALDILR